jgi:hypothetical protein
MPYAVEPSVLAFGVPEAFLDACSAWLWHSRFCWRQRSQLVNRRLLRFIASWSPLTDQRRAYCAVVSVPGPAARCICCRQTGASGDQWATSYCCSSGGGRDVLITAMVVPMPGDR